MVVKEFKGSYRAYSLYLFYLAVLITPSGVALEVKDNSTVWNICL